MSDGTFRRQVVAAIPIGAAVVAGLGVGSAYVPWLPGDCREAIVPSAEFAVERSGSGLAVVHHGGFEFTRSNTEALLLVVEDADGGRSTRLNWYQADASFDPDDGDDGSTYPIGHGDRVTLDRRRIGFDPGAVDRVAVVWRGRPSVPGYCPNHDPAPPVRTVELASLRPGDDRRVASRDGGRVETGGEGE